MSTQKMVYVANVRDVPLNMAKRFIYPTADAEGTKRPALLIHLKEGFVAYEGLCTHLGAELEWNSDTGKIWCTLHDGMYDPKTGAPFRGMPKKPIRKFDLKIEKNGDIYALI